MLVVVAEEAKNLYSSVLYACYSSLLGGKTTHVSAIGAQTILSLKTCSSESSFLLRNESFADMNMHLLTAFVQKLMKSSLARRFKCSVDMLVLHLSIVACSRNYTIDRKRTIFNAEYERSASDQIIWTAANHPILWCMTVPVFLQVMEQLVCKTDLQAYSFPMRSVDDLLFLHASSRPGHTRSHMLALTLSPQVDRTDEVVIFISNLKVAIESIKEVERSSINANVGPIWASPYSITRGKEPFSKLSEYVVNYFDQNFATDKGASFLQNGDS